MIRLTLPFFVLLATTACGRFKEENWPETAARASCEALRRCNPVGFFASYDTLDECIPDTIVVPDGATGCAYDADLARECVQALGWRCEKLGERWDEVDTLCRAVSECGVPPADTGS